MYVALQADHLDDPSGRQHKDVTVCCVGKISIFNANISCRKIKISECCQSAWLWLDFRLILNIQIRGIALLFSCRCFPFSSFEVAFRNTFGNGHKNTDLQTLYFKTQNSTNDWWCCELKFFIFLFSIQSNNLPLDLKKSEGKLKSKNECKFSSFLCLFMRLKHELTYRFLATIKTYKVKQPV